MEGRLLCNAVFRAADECRGMSAVPILVICTAGVVGAAFFGEKVNDLERGYGAAAKVFVCRPDAGARHKDVHALCIPVHPGWTVLLVEPPFVGVEAVKPPGGHVHLHVVPALLEKRGLAVRTAVVILVKLGGLMPYPVCLHNRLRDPCVLGQLFFDIVHRPRHHEDAQPAFFGVTLELWNCPSRYVLCQVLQKGSGATVGERDHPRAPAGGCHLRIVVHNQLHAGVHHDFGALARQVLLGLPIRLGLPNLLHHLVHGKREFGALLLLLLDRCCTEAGERLRAGDDLENRRPRIGAFLDSFALGLLQLALGASTTEQNENAEDGQELRHERLLSTPECQYRM
mmetsp:Transcript_113268/g.300951  ORF Transcript_113268/g.300951 Transcript_113268/m.300951 type:complete len:341 (+) Transcript_113268:1216-2238(+)